MGSNRKGGLQAAITNKERHGEDFYVRLGTKGGRVSRGGGFAADRDLARRAGKIGGTISKRRPAVKRVIKQSLLARLKGRFK